jgi:uncharacterized protein YggE
MDNQNKECCSEKMFYGCKISKIIFLAIFVLFLISLIVWFGVGTMNKLKEGRYIGQEIETKNTITVSGTGEIYTKPDLSIVDFSAVTDKKTVAEAITENTKAMNGVIDSIKKQGVADKDLKTTSFTIYPRYEWQKEITCLIYPCPESKRVLVGYEITQTLEVKIRDMAKIGDIIQGATDAGANQAGDLQFTIEKEDEFKKQARTEAITEAKAKADELSSQLGVKLVRITNFSESGTTPVPMPLYMEAKATGGETETPQIQTGENKISVTVSITYEIN